MDVQRIRRKRAFGVVACLGLALVLSCALSSLASALEEPSGSPVDMTCAVLSAARSDETVDQEALFEDLVNEMGGCVLGGCGELPLWFESEVLKLSGRQAIYLFGEGTVVGFLDARPAETVESWLESELSSKGWHLVRADVSGTWTAVKEGGDIPWLSLSCTQVSNETCVVVQVPLHP